MGLQRVRGTESPPQKKWGFKDGFCLYLQDKGIRKCVETNVSEEISLSLPHDIEISQQAKINLSRPG
jgi:hypothetical protein